MEEINHFNNLHVPADRRSCTVTMAMLIKFRGFLIVIQKISSDGHVCPVVAKVSVWSLASALTVEGKVKGKFTSHETFYIEFIEKV